MAEQLSQDMKDLLETLNRWQAQYLVVGAHALGLYTEPRSTKDLDVWVNPTPENAKLVYGALKEYGAPLIEATEQFFTETRYVPDHRGDTQPNRHPQEYPWSRVR